MMTQFRGSDKCVQLEWTQQASRTLGVGMAGATT